MKVKLLIILSILFLTLGSSIYAQVGSSGLAITVPIKDSDVKEGDIICSYSEGNKRCVNEYDTSIFGVITDNPAAAIKDPDLENSRLLATTGVARERVSSEAGNIK